VVLLWSCQQHAAAARAAAATGTAGQGKAAAVWRAPTQPQQQQQPQRGVAGSLLQLCSSHHGTAAVDGLVVAWPRAGAFKVQFLAAGLQGAIAMACSSVLLPPVL
jgi:hypothetical protein